MTPSDAAKLRARAEHYQARADRLERICAMFAGRSAHLRKERRFSEAADAERKARRASDAEQRCLLKAFGCRIAAARLEHAEGRAKALMGVAA